MIRMLSIIAMFLFCMRIPSLTAQEKVIVGGSGSLIEEMTELAKAYMAKHPSESIQVLQESMSNTGGMEGTKIGRLTIGLVTDAPHGADREKLVYRSLGRTPAGVALHRSTPVSNLSEAQVCGIFSGKITSWKEVGGNDAKILVLTRKRDDANSRAFRERMTCFKDLQITPDAIALARGSEMFEALDKRPNTIGIINVDADIAERQNAKTIAVDGIPPSPETVQNGKYKFYTEKGVVTLGAPQGAAKRFLEYVVGAEGHKILVSRGIIPVK